MLHLTALPENSPHCSYAPQVWFPLQTLFPLMARPMWSPWTPPPAGILWPAGSGPPTPPSRQRPRQGGPAALASWGPRGHSSLTVKGTAGGEGQGPVSVTSFHFSPATRKTQDSVWRSERRLRGPGVLDRGGPGTRPGLSQPHLTASGVGQGLLWPVSPA